MKKLMAIIALVTVFSFSSCEDWSPESEQQQSEEKGSIVGDWYSNQLSSIYSFGEDKEFRIKIDISDTMTIDSSGVAHLTGSDVDYSDYCSYDGENFVFNIEGNFEMLNMKRKDGLHDSNPYGSYTLISGYLYDEFSEEFGDVGEKYGINVGEESLVAEITLCSYFTEGNQIILSGNDLSYFGAEKNDDSTLYYDLQGDILTIINGEEVITFSRVNQE